MVPKMVFLKLKHKYTRSQLVSCKEMLLDLKILVESSKEKEITLREAAGCSSLMVTQGYQRCHCKMKCKTNKCTCRLVVNYAFQNVIVHCHIKINNNITI